MSLPAFYFATATEIRFGRGEGRRAVSDLAGLSQRVLLVHGASAARADWLRDAVIAEGCAVAGFAVAAEPNVAMIAVREATAREAGAQAGTVRQNPLEAGSTAP